MEEERPLSSFSHSLTRIGEALHVEAATAHLAQEYLAQVWEIYEQEVDAAQKECHKSDNSLLGALLFIASKARQVAAQQGNIKHLDQVGISQVIRATIGNSM